MNPEARARIREEISKGVRTSRGIDQYRITFDLDHLTDKHVVLDVGAGDSEFAEKMRKRKIRVVRLDPDYLSYPPRDKKDTVVGIVQELPFRDDTFDEVLASWSMYYVKTGTKVALAELLRVTKPGGRVQISPGVIKDEGDSTQLPNVALRDVAIAETETVIITKPHGSTPEEIAALVDQLDKTFSFYNEEVCEKWSNKLVQRIKSIGKALH